jgi:predicted P-loop ATPase
MATLRYDALIEIATAHSRLSKKWKNKRVRWSELVDRCRETKRTGETLADYHRMTREEQSGVKDVGGFVGGYLSGGERKTTNVLYRTVATLDIDYGTPNVWDDFTLAFSCAAMMYSTHKHTKDKPRYRLVIPFNRQVTAQEYEPLCRKIAAVIGMDLFDITTYQLPRLFYWPSTSKDGEYVFEVQDGPMCDVDKILGEYINFNDVSEWPLASRESEAVAHEIRKAGNPLEKPGLIGAFCRTYTIEDVIEKFLQDVYEKTAHADRYTYRKGSVAGGLVCYDGKFAYSHHETDPASRQLCNAFDLCRIHLFGVHDEGSRVTDITRKPSYNMMQEMAADDKEVRMLIATERRAQVGDDFDGIDPDGDTGEEGEDKEARKRKKLESMKWMGELEMDKRGNIKSTAKNIMLVLENDPKLKGHMWHDLFSSFDMVEGGLPWDPNATQWGNKDDANLRIFMEENYGITGKDKIKDAKDAVLTKYKKHPIRDYLNALEWDGTPRLDKLIIDYMGAEDTPLNRAFTRKHFTAAVARVMNPGCKYDYCLILRGTEGIGKSTLFNTMAGQWFNDSLITTEGKTGMEQLRGSWLIELAELASIKRSDVEQVKNFLSKKVDIYRPSYGIVMERYPRQCVFSGTTNEEYFLKGETGNRRFWVIAVNKDLRTKQIDPGLAEERDQMWAEAVYRYRHGEKLYLTPELEEQARAVQTTFNDDSDDPMRGMLEQYLQTKLPIDWETWDLARRRAFFANPDPLEEDGVVERQYVCAAEFICERLQRNMTDKEYRYLARKICAILRDMQDWQEIGPRRFATLYGIQKMFKRLVANNSEIDDADL